MNIQQQPSGFYVHMNGQIESCKISGSSHLYVKYSYQAGPDWSLLHGIDHGISQISSTSSAITTDADLYVWNYPLECIYRSTNISGWPQLIVSVYDLTTLGADIIRGYGWIHLPMTPGIHTRYIPLFTPISSSWMQRFTSWLTNNPPEYFDSKFVAQTMGREVTRTQSQGAVKVTFQITTKNMQTFGYQTIGEMKNIQATNILYGSQLMTTAADIKGPKKPDEAHTNKTKPNTELFQSKLKDYPSLPQASAYNNSSWINSDNSNTNNMNNNNPIPFARPSSGLFSPAASAAFDEKHNDNLTDYGHIDHNISNKGIISSSTNASSRNSLRNSLINPKSSPSNRRTLLADNNNNVELTTATSWQESPFTTQTDDIQSVPTTTHSQALDNTAALHSHRAPAGPNIMDNIDNLEANNRPIIDRDDLIPPTKISAGRRSNLFSEAREMDEEPQAMMGNRVQEEQKEQIVAEPIMSSGDRSSNQPSRVISQRNSLKKPLPLLPTVIPTRSAATSLHPSRRGSGANIANIQNNKDFSAKNIDSDNIPIQTAGPSTSTESLLSSITDSMPEPITSTSSHEVDQQTSHNNQAAEMDPVKYSPAMDFSSTMPFTTLSASTSPTSSTPPLPVQSAITLAPISARPNRLQPMKLPISMAPKANLT